MSDIIPSNREGYNPLQIYNPYPYLMPQPESSETAIARQNPETAAEVLKDISKKILYKNLAISVRGVSNTYIHCLREVDAPSLKKSNQLDIDVEMKANRGMRRVLFGEEERGFSMSVKLR